MASEVSHHDSAASNGSGGINGSKQHSPNGVSGVVNSSSTPVSSKAPGTPFKANRQGVTSAFTKFGQLIQAFDRPMPTQNGDGTFYDAQMRTGLRQDLKVVRWKDVKTLRDLVKSKLKGEQLVDDKTMIMERVIQLVSNLPANSKTRLNLTNNFLNELWYTLEHPASIYVSDQFKYRMADGSYNNLMLPQLGAAGTTYARSVRPCIMPPGALPDPNLIYDSVMKRTEYRKHPNNVSSILWYWASIIIHDLFWTDYRDMTKSKTSSYLDLSPLYGSNQEMQNTIRTFKQGKLKADCFADKRLLGMPPGVGVLLIMFNRFHNYVCDNLMAINEGGRFTPPAANLDEEKAAGAWKKYDEDLFQTARLVTSGLYINITLVDYVRNIVNLNRADTTWTLDPRQDMGVDAGTTKGAERGVGNVVSAEFNLCYRWHSCISAKDDQWIQDAYYELFGKQGKDLTPQDMMVGFMKFDQMMPEDPAQRPFGKFKRGPDGKFSDDELVECISQGVEDCAGAFGGRNVPEAMRAVEVLGIIQGRKWNLAGLNEFRKHFGLKPYERFEDINSDPGIADGLRHLYGHPDFVELYPGIVAEEAKPPMVPGVGIAPTYTISRVVLSDAVCLVRGDRHYTTDYNPRYLTNWGYNEVQYDLNVNNGCVFYKLFIRAFPDHFKPNSVYAHYPMVIPSENRKILTNIGTVGNFDFSRPGRVTSRINVTSYGGAKHVLESEDKYKLTMEGGTSFVQQPYPSDWTANVRAFYKQAMEQLLQEKSYLLAGQRQVDLVRDVANIAPVHFASRVFNLPLKTKADPKGVYTEEELYTVVGLIAVSTLLDTDPVKSYSLHQAATAVSGQLGRLVEDRVKLARSFGVRGMFSGSASSKDPLNAHGASVIKGLAKAGLSTSDIAYGQILPAIAATVPSQAEVFVQAVDYFLSPQGAVHIPDIHRVANQPSSRETDALLLGYVMEGTRLAGSFGAYRKAVVADIILEDDGLEHEVKPGDRVSVSFAAAAQDSRNFPDPETVDPRRPLDAYLQHGPGPLSCLGAEGSQAALSEMFRALFKRRNVRRAPGPQGELKKVPGPGGAVAYLREDWGALWPFPVSMKIMWDNE